MKDKSKVVLVAVIIIIAAIIAYVCYGFSNGKKKPIVTMDVSYKDGEGNEKNGTVKIELDPNVAPESVSNFIALANNGFYNGLTFHRIEDYVVQGGDKKGDGTGSANYSDLFQKYEVTEINGKKATCKKKKSLTEAQNDENAETMEINVSKLPKDIKVGDIVWYKDGKYQKGITDYVYSIKGEFAANGINNTLKFEKGVIGMARSDYSSYGMTEEGYNSASSQFFFVTTDDKSTLNSLNQRYASFGKVVEGYEYIEEIGKLYVDKKSDDSEKTAEENAEPKEADVPKITNVTVETFGAKYGLPNVINFDTIQNQISQYQKRYNQLMSSYQQ